MLLYIDQEGSGCRPFLLTRYVSIILKVDSASLYLQLSVTARYMGRCISSLDAEYRLTAHLLQRRYASKEGETASIYSLRYNIS
jgi:hypothetical protein